MERGGADFPLLAWEVVSAYAHTPNLVQVSHPLLELISVVLGYGAVPFAFV